MGSLLSQANSYPLFDFLPFKLFSQALDLCYSDCMILVPSLVIQSFLDLSSDYEPLLEQVFYFCSYSFYVLINLIRGKEIETKAQCGLVCFLRFLLLFSVFEFLRL